MVDTLGLLIALVVHRADVQERQGGQVAAGQGSLQESGFQLAEALFR